MLDFPLPLPPPSPLLRSVAPVLAALRPPWRSPRGLHRGTRLAPYIPTLSRAGCTRLRSSGAPAGPHMHIRLGRARPAGQPVWAWVSEVPDLSLPVDQSGVLPRSQEGSAMVSLLHPAKLTMVQQPCSCQEGQATHLRLWGLPHSGRSCSSLHSPRGPGDDGLQPRTCFAVTGDANPTLGGPRCPPLRSRGSGYSWEQRSNSPTRSHACASACAQSPTAHWNVHCECRRGGQQVFHVIKVLFHRRLVGRTPLDVFSHLCRARVVSHTRCVLGVGRSGLARVQRAGSCLLCGRRP